MSAGAFLRSKYAADYGTGTAIHPIRVQPETLELVVDSEANDPPAGAISNPISAVSSRGKRQLGLTPRFITLQLPAVGQPAGYKPSGIIRVPALTFVFWEAVNQGDSCIYLGVTCEIVSKSAESAR